MKGVSEVSCHHPYQEREMADFCLGNTTLKHKNNKLNIRLLTFGKCQQLPQWENDRPLADEFSIKADFKKN